MNISGVGRLEHAMPLFEDLHMLAIVNLHDFCSSQFMHDQIHQTSPVTIIAEVFNTDIHRYCSRGSESVRILYRRTENAANSFVNTS